MLEIEVIIDGKRYIKRLTADENILEISNLMNIIGAHFEKAGVSFEYKQRYTPLPKDD